jgi:hypothetical protein
MEEFWLSLTPEKSFLVRVFVDHCVSIKEALPLKKYFLSLLSSHSVPRKRTTPSGRSGAPCVEP